MVPSAFLSVLTMGPGPDSGGSKKRIFRPHVPERSGIGAVSAPMAGQTKIDAEMKPAAARPKYFLEMTRMLRARIRHHLTLPH